MDEQKEKQNAKKKRSTLPIYAIGAVWLLYAKKLDSFRGILSCAVVSLIVYAILRIVMRGKKSEEPPKTAAPEQPSQNRKKRSPSRSRSLSRMRSFRRNCNRSSIRASAPLPISAV